MTELWLPVLMLAIAEPIWLHMWILLCKIRCGCSMSVIIMLYGLLIGIMYILGQQIINAIVQPNMPGWVNILVYVTGVVPASNFFYSIANMLTRR
jgi:hypothetical protein